MAEKKISLQLNVDLRVVCGVLMLVIVAMLIAWRPWEGAKDRTVQVTGEAKVSAAPDEFVFYPIYQSKNTDRQAALDELNKKNAEIVAKLKALGVPENKIKTTTNGINYPDYPIREGGPEPQTSTYTLQLTVTVPNLDEAQKVQTYLVTTAPTGEVSPVATFSEQKTKELQSKAREDATKDARTKAEQMAKNLGFRVGAVKTVEEGAGFGTYPTPLPARGLDVAADAATSKLSVQPGENELAYQVNVTYFVR